MQQSPLPVVRDNLPKPYFTYAQSMPADMLSLCVPGVLMIKFNAGILPRV
jgi:hypothetical protein